MTEPMVAGVARLRLPSLLELKSFLEAKDWAALMEALELDSVWAFDRPLPVAAAVGLLAEVLAEARDVKLLVTGVRRWESRENEVRASFVSCLMWGEAATWTEHEHDFDLHLGVRSPETGGWRVSYLGVTAAAPGPSR